MTRYLAKCHACNAVTSGLSEGQHCHRVKEDPAREGAVYTYEPTKGQPAQAVPGGSSSIAASVGAPGTPRP